MGSKQTLGVYDEDDIKRGTHLNLFLQGNTRLFPRLIELLTELSFLYGDLAPEEYRKLCSKILFRFSKCRFIRSFTPAEFSAIEHVLPSEQILHVAISNMMETDIYMKLTIKSMVTLLCEDFPHLEGLLYCEKMQRIDEFLDAISQLDVPPFVDYSDLYFTRTKGQVLGQMHPWWTIGYIDIASINGVSVEEGERLLMLTRRDRYGRLLAQNIPRPYYVCLLKDLIKYWMRNALIQLINELYEFIPFV